MLLLICVFSFGRSYNFFVFVYLLVGLAAGVYLPCGISLLAEEFSPHNRAKVIGIHQTASSISFLIMPLLVGLLLNVSSWRSIVLLFSALGIAVFVALIKLVRTTPAQTLPAKMDYSSLLRDKRIWVLAILGGITSSCNIGIYAIVPLFLVSERGFSVLAANQVLGMSRIGGVLAPFIAGVLADRFGYISTLIPVMVLFGLFTILITMGQTGSSVVIVLLVQASATAGFWPLSYALVTGMIDSANRGPAVVMVTIFGLASGMGLTPWLLGTVADHYSFSYGIITLGVIAMISPLLLRLFR